MLKTTLEVGCDNCQTVIVVPPAFSARTNTTPRWQFNSFSEEYHGNVIIHDVKRWLQDIGWKVDLEWEPIIECPTCKQEERDA